MIRPEQTDAGSVSLGRKGGLGMSGTGDSSIWESRSRLVEKGYCYGRKIGEFEVEYGRPMGGSSRNRANGRDRESGSFTAARVRADYL